MTKKPEAVDSGRRDRRPRPQRGGDARAQRAAGCTPTSAAHFPFTGRSPSPTTPAPTRTSAIAARAGRPSCPACARLHLDREGPRARAARGVVGSATRAVLAYMDVDLSTDLDALLPLVAPLVSGHSDLAIGTRLAPRLAGRARAEARAHLPLLQPDPARAARGRASPTRSAGSRRSAPTSPHAAAAAGRGHRLVLRHRAAGARRAQRAAHPRGAGRLGRRPRQPRRHRRRPRRRPAGRRADGPGAATGALPLGRAARRLGPAAATDDVRRAWPRQLSRSAPSARLHARLPAAVRRCCAGAGRAGRPTWLALLRHARSPTRRRTAGSPSGCAAGTGAAAPGAGAASSSRSASR